MFYHGVIMIQGTMATLATLLVFLAHSGRALHATFLVSLSTSTSVTAVVGRAFRDLSVAVHRPRCPHQVVNSITVASTSDCCTLGRTPRGLGKIELPNSLLHDVLSSHA